MPSNTMAAVPPCGLIGIPLVACRSGSLAVATSSTHSEIPGVGLAFSLDLGVGFVAGG